MVIEKILADHESLIANATEAIELGTGVTALIHRGHPINVAQAAAALGTPVILLTGFGDLIAATDDAPTVRLVSLVLADAVSAPPPKKWRSVCSMRYLRARWSARLRRFSFTSMVCCLSHCAQASLETFSQMRLPSAPG